LILAERGALLAVIVDGEQIVGVFDDDDMPTTGTTETNVNDYSVTGCSDWEDTGNVNTLMECPSARNWVNPPPVWAACVDATTFRPGVMKFH
jgi:hypothetical protein